MSPRRAVLGLGSNLGDRAFHLRAAVAALVDEVVATSGVWETEPVGGPEQGSYLNLVVVLRTERSPHELLDVARRLESAAQRVRSERWGPRTLDVDVLWVDGETVDDHELTVPHPRMFERDFVLAPLDEVAGDLIPSEWVGPGADVRRLGPIDGTLPLPPEGEPGPAGMVERRRQVLESALDIHPDLYLDQLVTALAAAGLGAVEEDELVADLGALGYDVDPDEEVDPEPEPDPEPEVAPAPVDDGPSFLPRPTIERDDPDDAAPRPTGPVALTDAFADDLRSPATDDREPRTVLGIDRTVVIAAAVALLVVVVAFALAAIGGDDDDPTVADGPPAADTGADGPTDGTTDGTTDGPGTTAATAPVGPGADPELADGGDASLSFDDADGEEIPDLGDLQWDVVLGAVSVVDGRAVATPGDGGDGAAAVVDTGTRDLRFELALPEVTPGAGIAFGFQDDGSHLLWAPAPGFPTVALFRVSDGEFEFVLNGGVSEDLGPGTRLGVRIDGSEVELLARGAVLATYSDDSGSTLVGAGLLPDSAFGVFDDVVWAAGG